MSIPLATYGAIAFILGRYLYKYESGRLLRIGSLLAIAGTLILLVAAYQVWISMDQAFDNEPLFISTWLALPMLWFYREHSMLIPLQESLVASGWSLIAVLLSQLFLERLPVDLLTNLSIIEGAESDPKMTSIMVISMVAQATVFFAALQVDPVLSQVERPYIFALAFTLFSVGLTSLTGKPFPPIRMDGNLFLILSIAPLAVIRLRPTANTVAWIRLSVDLLLWLILIIITATTTLKLSS